MFHTMDHSDREVNEPRKVLLGLIVVCLWQAADNFHANLENTIYGNFREFIISNSYIYNSPFLFVITIQIKVSCYMAYTGKLKQKCHTYFNVILRLNP